MDRGSEIVAAHLKFASESAGDNWVGCWVFTETSSETWLCILGLGKDPMVDLCFQEATNSVSASMQKS